MTKKMFEINGVKYVTPNVFADYCECSRQKIVSACCDGRVVGAQRDSSGHWIIPIEASKPLEIERIRELLILTLALKNRPSTILGEDENANPSKIYRYLEATGYIEHFDCSGERAPYEAVLTDKGMALATNGPIVDLNFVNLAVTAIQVFASILTILNACYHGI